VATPVNIAVVGAGYWGQKLLAKFVAAPQAAVQVICDLHAENLAVAQSKFPDISVTNSLDGVLADAAVNAVVLATPPASHYALAKKVLQAKKHVWIEKPLALRMDEGRDLVRLAKQSNAVLFVDHTFLYDPAVRIVREMILNGELGEVYHLFLQRLNLGRIKRDSNIWWNSAPHDVSIVLYLLSDVPVGINLHGYSYLQPHLQDLNVAVLETSSHISAFIYHNWIYPENTAKLTVVGSKRLLVYEGKFEKRSITVYEYEIGDARVNARAQTQLPTTIPSKVISQHELQGFQEQEPLAAAVRDFLESIENRRAPLSDGDFSLKVLAVLEAGERSLRANGAQVGIDFSSLQTDSYARMPAV
jgi:UDP-2-acetamido-3-amino-2,3-dideoxy-glucuronate N-acetyltransferase